MKYVALFLTTLMLAMLSSCIDGEEEVFIKADGSARVKAVYRVPALLMTADDSEEMRTNITEEVERHRNLKLLTNRVENVGGERIITIEIEMDDMMQVGGILSGHTSGVKPSKADQMLHAIMGNISVALVGLKVDFSREVDLDPLLNGRGTSFLGDSEFRYIVHLPEAAESSNAHVVEDGGRTLRWAFKLSECGEKPIVLSMVAPVPLPWWVYALAVVVGAFLLWGVCVLVRKWKARHPRVATP